MKYKTLCTMMTPWNSELEYSYILCKYACTIFELFLSEILNFSLLHTQAWAVCFEEVEAAVCSGGGAGETNKHVHERREELGWEEITA